MLFAENSDGKRISKLIPVGTDQKLTLPNGTWSMAIIGWDGSNPMEGYATCFSKSQIVLTGAEVSIDAELTTAHCADDVFGGPAISDAVKGFKAFRMAGCSGLNGVTASFSTCDGVDRGFHRSFKVSALQYDQTVDQTTSVALESVCLVAGGPYGMSGSNLRLPQAQSGLLSFSVKGYEDSNCTLSPSSLMLNDGFNSGNSKSFIDTGSQALFVVSKGALQTISIFSEPVIGADTGMRPKAVKLGLNSAGGPYVFLGSPKAGGESILLQSPDIHSSGATPILSTSVNPAGLEAVLSFIKHGAAVYFVAKSVSDYNYELFKFDGASVVSVFQAAVPGIAVGDDTGIRTQLVAFGTSIYFGYRAQAGDAQELCVLDTVSSATDCSINNPLFDNAEPVVATSGGVIYRALEIADGGQKMFSFVAPSTHNLLYNLFLDQTTTGSTIIDSFGGVNFLNLSGAPFSMLFHPSGLTLDASLRLNGKAGISYNGNAAYVSDLGVPQLFNGSIFLDFDTILGTPLKTGTGTLETTLLGSYSTYLYLSSNRGNPSQNLYVYNSADNSFIQFTSESGTGYFTGAVLGNAFYFVTNYGATNLTLSKVEASVVTPISILNSSPSNVQSFKVLGSLMYFGVDDGTNGVEPWVSDGSAAGTFLLKDVAPGPTSTFPSFYETTVNGYVFFKANDFLYRTKGTVDSTEIQYASPVSDIATYSVEGIDDGLMMNSYSYTSSINSQYFIRPSP